MLSDKNRSIRIFIFFSTENFEITPTRELTPNGFIDLNLMEARDPQGGPDELWITIESFGYSKKLQLCMVSDL